jgi:hypothetical protein
MSSYSIHHKEPIKFFLLRKNISIVKDERTHNRVIELSISESFKRNLFKINLSLIKDTCLPHPTHVVSCINLLTSESYWISKDALYDAFEELTLLDF